MSFDDIDLQWFAAEDEGRTEEPSEFKLRKAREEGRVAKSPEIAAALVMLVTIVTLIALAPMLLRQCEEVLRFFFTRVTEKDALRPTYLVISLRYLLRMVMPLASVGIVAAVAANLVQNRGFLFSVKPITPDLNKIVPRLGQYLKKTVFSFEGSFNVVKSLVKIVFIALIAYVIIRANIARVLELLNAGSVRAAVGCVAGIAAQILVACAVLFLVISVPDYFVQRRQFIESMKMTKQEVKQEYKEMEGDPEVKSRLRQMQQQLLQQNMPRAVAESDVVITNPTHFAVALQYDAVKADAPIVAAKGADEVALRMRTIAYEHDVPVVENRSLARALYTNAEIGDIIPEAYIKAIATIYTQIDYLNKKK